MAKTTLTGINQQTDWYDLRQATTAANFILTGAFDQAVSVHYSNNESANKGTDYTVDATTYSAAAGPLKIPFGACRFVRFASGGSWTASTVCTVSWGKVVDPDGQLVDVLTQSTTGQGS